MGAGYVTHIVHRSAACRTVRGRQRGTGPRDKGPGRGTRGSMPPGRGGQRDTVCAGRQQVHIPLIAAEAIGVPPVQRAEAVPPAVVRRLQRLIDGILPGWPQAVSEVTVLRQPQFVPQQAPAQSMAGAKTGVMTGITALQKQEASKLYSATNIAIRIYRFVPAELLDGPGLDTGLRCVNVIPYAAAPVPETYGDLMEWTVAHELWHVVDIQARVKHILGDRQGAEGKLDQVLQDPALWAGEFQEIHVADLLGWRDDGESYEQSDELSPPLRVTRGATSYTHVRGSFVVNYADGEYAFARQLVRAGHIPEEFEMLEDLEPLLKSGQYPTLYALFNTEDERFAEYGVWYLFARLHGARDKYAEMSEKLADYYEERWEAARSELCSL